jgi:transcriptional regulatory protein LevR
MGSLANYSWELERELRVQVRCISMVSTSYVIEAGRKALLGYSLQDVFEDTRELATRMMSKIADKSPNQPEKNRSKATPGPQLYLLTVCTTGEGSARILENHLLKNLDRKGGLCEIVSLQISSNQEFLEQVENLSVAGRIIGVVSAFSTAVSAPHFKLSSVMAAPGLEALQKHIDTEALFIRIGNNMQQTFPGLGSGGGVWRIRDMIERICRALDTHLDSETLIGLFCHICCMLDRLGQGEKVGQFPDVEGWMQKYPQEITLVREEYDRLANSYQTVIPLSEVCFILMFFKKETLL